VHEFAQFVANGLVIGATYTLAALGLTLIFGHMGLINFAHGGIYTLGAFFAYTTVALVGLPFGIGVVLAVAGVMAVAAVTEHGLLRPVRRFDQVYMPMLATIALAIVIPNAAILIWSPTPKRLPSPISGDSLDLGIVRLAPQELLIVATAIAAIAALHAFFFRSRGGSSMRAAFADPDAAWLMGINVNRMYTGAFALGSGLAALAGALISTVVLITPTIGAFVTLKSFVVVILGGLRSFGGTVAAGLLLGVAESLAGGYIDASYKDAVGLAILVLALVFLPRGLVGAAAAVER
jgi:branched-chain amino acid transport system permease protein